MLRERRAALEKENEEKSRIEQQSKEAARVAAAIKRKRCL
jgi:hypothetical protein